MPLSLSRADLIRTRNFIGGRWVASIGRTFGVRDPSNDSVITERLLSISGEDSLTVDRKYREPWTGKLPSRFLILSNELPRLTDSSGALASRFVMLTMVTSFYGREDSFRVSVLRFGP